MNNKLYQQIDKDQEAVLKDILNSICDSASVWTVTRRIGSTENSPWILVSLGKFSGNMVNQSSHICLLDWGLHVSLNFTGSFVGYRFYTLLLAAASCLLLLLSLLDFNTGTCSILHQTPSFFWSLMASCLKLSEYHRQTATSCLSMRCC